MAFSNRRQRRCNSRPRHWSCRTPAMSIPAALPAGGMLHWRPGRPGIHRVVLLGRRIGGRSYLALPEAAAFATPLGNVRIDTAGVAAIAGLPQVVFSDAVHAFEHALEVQLPFLQRLLGSSTPSLPLAVGDAGPAAVAEVLERVWGGRRR